MSFVIAIDGPAAAGKGTLSRRLADKYGFARLDTGRLYRAVGWRVLQEGGNPLDEAQAVKAAQTLAPYISQGLLDSDDLNSGAAGAAASQVAKNQAVRDALFEFQRDFAAQAKQGHVTGVILDGRDIGTVICPDADLKLFVTASFEERAKRRHAELVGRGETVDIQTVLKDMQERDTRDQNRDSAPMVAAPDAILVDTTGKNSDEVLAFVVSLVETHLKIR